MLVIFVMSVPIFTSVENLAVSGVTVAPNPVIENAYVSFVLDEGKYLSIDLVDLNGSTIKQIYERFADGGEFRLSWYPSDIDGTK